MDSVQAARDFIQSELDEVGDGMNPTLRKGLEEVIKMLNVSLLLEEDDHIGRVSEDEIVGIAEDGPWNHTVVVYTEGDTRRWICSCGEEESVGA
jgi:hypothetical protein